MNNCIYYVEGECEKKLIAALKEHPALIMPGKIKVRNVITGLIPKSELLSIKEKTVVVMVFDTDVDKTDLLIKNMENLRKLKIPLKIITVAQIPDFESELVRSTNVKNVTELTRSASKSDFKRDFCRLSDCRNTLNKHDFNLDLMWTQKTTGQFSFVEQQSSYIKLDR